MLARAAEVPLQQALPLGHRNPSEQHLVDRLAERAARRQRDAVVLPLEDAGQDGGEPAAVLLPALVEAGTDPMRARARSSGPRMAPCNDPIVRLAVMAAVKLEMTSARMTFRNASDRNCCATASQAVPWWPRTAMASPETWNGWVKSSSASRRSRSQPGVVPRVRSYRAGAPRPAYRLFIAAPMVQLHAQVSYEAKRAGGA